MVFRRLTAARRSSPARRLAAAWFARSRVEGKESAALLDWIKADPARERAYGSIEDTWDALQVLEEDFESRRAAERAAAPMWPAGWAKAATLAAVVALCLWGGSYWSQPFDQHYGTGVGDQQVVPLSDGSLLTLNTDSKVDLQVDRRLREVRLARGEAFFDVAHHDGAPPFEVLSGAVKIRVVGTKFNVRRVADGVNLDVLQGRVEIRRIEESNASAPVIATAGQHVSFDAAGLVKARSASPVELVDGWRRGWVRLDDMPLREAVQEMNRYSGRKLVIGSPGIGDMRVSGLFNIGSVDSFARALHLSRGVHVTKNEDEIMLMEGRPQTNN